MKNGLQSLVRQFHERFGAPAAERPTLIPDDRARLRVRLIAEELQEYARAAGLQMDVLLVDNNPMSPVDAVGEPVHADLVEVADALGDLLYVVFGSGVEHGLHLDPVFREIHRSNMTKDGGGADSGGKILKGPRYEPPNLQGLIADQQAGKVPKIEEQDGSAATFERIIDILRRPNVSQEEFQTACLSALDHGFYDAKRAGWEQGLAEVIRIVNHGLGEGLKRGLPVKCCMVPATNILTALESIKKKGPFKWFVEGDGQSGGAQA